MHKGLPINEHMVELINVFSTSAIHLTLTL